MQDKQTELKITTDLGNTLREAREKLGLTQVEVATKSRVSVNYYARIERGGENLTYLKLYRILKTLEIKYLKI